MYKTCGHGFFKILLHTMQIWGGLALTLAFDSKVIVRISEKTEM